MKIETHILFMKLLVYIFIAGKKEHLSPQSQELLPFDAYDRIHTSDLDLAMTSDLCSDDLNFCMDTSNSEALFTEIHSDALKIGNSQKTTEDKTSSSKTSPVSELFKVPVAVANKGVMKSKITNKTIKQTNGTCDKVGQTKPDFSKPQNAPKTFKQVEQVSNDKQSSRTASTPKIVDNTCNAMDDSFTFSMVEQCLASEEIPSENFDVHISSKVVDNKKVVDNIKSSVIANKTNSSRDTPCSPLLVNNNSSHSEKYSQLYKLTPGTDDFLNAMLDESPAIGQKIAPARKRTQRNCKSPSSPLSSKSSSNKNGKISKSKRKSSSGSFNTSRNNSCNSSMNSNVSDCLPPTPPETNVGQSAKVNTPNRLIGGSGMTPTRSDQRLNKTERKSKTNARTSKKGSETKESNSCATSESYFDKVSVTGNSGTPRRHPTKPKKKRLSPICSSSRSPQSNHVLPNTHSETNSASNQNILNSNENLENIPSEVDISASEFPLTNEAFSIVDVAASSQVRISTYPDSLTKTSFLMLHIKSIK